MWLGKAGVAGRGAASPGAAGRGKARIFERMLTVTTFFWQDSERQRNYQFTHDHVRILKRMVKRHLSIPHKFVCVTNEKITGVKTIPLNMEKHVGNTVFARLWMRSPDYPIRGRILNFDLDVVIVDSIDPIVDRKEDCVLWRNPNYEWGNGRAFYQTSIQLFDSGTRPELWDDFNLKETPQWVNRRFGGREQAWYSERLPWTEAHWTDADGIYGAGRLFHGEMDGGVTTKLPDNARIVSFPGNRIPDQPEVQKLHPWVVEHYK